MFKKFTLIKNEQFAGAMPHTVINANVTTSSQTIAKPNVVRSAFVKAWVVRSSAFSIQCGGLQRLFIHFSQPKYFYEKLSEECRDTPFGDISIHEGIFRKAGWHETHKTWIHCQSVGNWIGYDNPVSDFIWEKLCEHFLNEPFETWHILEKEGKSNIEDFCLEIQLSISLS